MLRPSFKDFVVLKETNGNDWRAESAAKPLQKGFIPPSNLKPIIRAFLNSGKIVLHQDITKPLTMPKKNLYLVGGPVRDFIKGKSIKDLDLATNATPEQVGTILSAAGFRWAGDRSGKGGSELKLPAHFQDPDGHSRKIEPARQGDNMVWYVKGRDNSPERKAFVVGAVVNGEEFDIATFRKDNGAADDVKVDFVDNPKEDAARRDLTINALYIELNNPDGENKKLFDPTGHGHYDLENGRVRTVGKAEERFEEDPLRVMRAIRFHCKFGSGEQLDPEIAAAIPKFLNLEERIALDRIRGEFIKGLMDPGVDLQKYLNIYQNTKLLHTVFPGLRFDAPATLPPQFKDRQDHVLALAWILQHNPTDKVAQTLSSHRQVGAEKKDSGWQIQERNAVLFLLKLKDFNEDQVHHLMRQRAGTGLTNKQIKDWADMFHKPGQQSIWGHKVKTFADHQPTVRWNELPQHLTADVQPHERGHVVAGLEAANFKDKLAASRRS
jgi:tRNA nucleotidyltransferase/poly(A) polymerase